MKENLKLFKNDIVEQLEKYKDTRESFESYNHDIGKGLDELIISSIINDKDIEVKTDITQDGNTITGTCRCSLVDKKPNDIKYIAIRIGDNIAVVTVEIKEDCFIISNIAVTKANDVVKEIDTNIKIWLDDYEDIDEQLYMIYKELREILVFITNI